ncbi:MAG: hypothetical protein WCQ66_08985 [Sphaerochaetaceae bacterium]
MAIGIFDLTGAQTFSLYDDAMRTHKDIPLSPALIFKTTHANQNPYIIDNASRSLFDLMDPLKKETKTDRIILLRQLLYALEHPTVSIDKLNQPTSVALEAFWKSQNRLLRQTIAKEQLASPEENILLIPDSASEDYQDTLLDAFGDRTHTRLLWRSITLFLGAESQLHGLGLKQDDNVLVLDETTTGWHGSVLCIKEESGRFIPCRKIYRFAQGGINRQYYPQMIPLAEWKNISIPECLTDKDHVAFPSFQWESWRWGECKTAKQTSMKTTLGPLLGQRWGNHPDIKAIISASSLHHLTEAFTHYVPIIHILQDDGTIQQGTEHFVSLVKNGQVPYYDQCETLRIVVSSSTNREEIEFKNLIDASDYVRGGFAYEKVRDIDHIFLDLRHEGNNQQEEDKKPISFYLLMGGSDKEAKTLPLKEYKPWFVCKPNVSGLIEIVFSPQLFPGQGKATVLVKSKGKEQAFTPFRLDWNQMNPTKCKNGEFITFAYLEENLERSFPPEVHAVQARVPFTSLMKWKMEQYIFTDDNPFYNRSQWPHRYEKGLNRFDRINVFGTDPIAKEPTSSPAFDKSLSHKFFFFLAQKYLNEQDDKIVKWLSWSYRGYCAKERQDSTFQKVTECILSKVEFAAKNQQGVGAAYFSYLANNMSQEKNCIRFFHAFCQRVQQPKQIGNWVNSGYQVFMYGEFITSPHINDSEVIKCMMSLCNVLDYQFKLSPDIQFTVMRNTLKCLLFLLKRRRFHETFCTQRGSGEDIKGYNRILGFQLNFKSFEHKMYGIEKELYDLYNVLCEFLKGKGIAGSIPIGGDDE